mmetsp:Transcript_30772/g.63946  ORF Transcript_30772/g.63946 Transcript_30772/m.63946 type:complete len:1296 (+) Transcript_30772:302-4189(+)
MAPKTMPKAPQPQKDFAKRPKAKVGKRAPAKLNSTDTAFKTASVAVRSQDGGLDKNNSNNDKRQALLKQLQQNQKDKSGGNHEIDINLDITSAAAKTELASSRGNALSTLQLSLKHHAAPVRASGLKGIRDAVQSLSTLIGGSSNVGDRFGSLGKTILESNLPALIPNMCRCWLDEDDAVRGLALNLFGDILNVMSTHSSQPTPSYGTDDLQSLVPFVPLLCAYTSSALNSLDRSVRKDGALLVGMLASSVASPTFSLLSTNSNTPSMSVEVGNHVDLFLPSLERLLSSMTLGGGSGRGSDGGSGSAARSVAKNEKVAGGMKKRKRNGINTKLSTTTATSVGSSGSIRGNIPASDSVLLSIAFLLKASVASNNGFGSSNELAGGNGIMGRKRLNPSLLVAGECTFLRGGSVHANSFMMFREMKENQSKSTTSPPKSIRGILDLPPMPSDDLIDDNEIIYNDEEATPYATWSGNSNDEATREKVQNLAIILETLRIKFVELVHLGRKSNDNQVGIILSLKELETLDIFIHTVRLVQRRFESIPGVENLRGATEKPYAGKSNKRQRKGDTKSSNGAIGPDNYRITASKLLLLLLENFPIRPLEHQYSQNSVQSQYELSNAGICSALAELGGDVVDADNSVASAPSWVDTVFSYIFPRLAYKSNDDDLKIDDPDESNPQAEESRVVATQMLLKVVKKLLLQTGGISGQFSKGFLLKNSLKRHELLEAFAGAFFPRLDFPFGFKGSNSQISGDIYDSSSADDVVHRIEKSASSSAGRAAALLVTSLVHQMSDGRGSGDASSLQKKGHLLILQMTSVLPLYLDAWKGLYPVESGLVLAFILSIVKQWSPVDNLPKHTREESQASRALTELCFGLRCSLDVLFVQTPSTLSSSTGKRSKTGVKNQSSIFESLPEPVQKLCIGLIGMLKCPTESLTKSLATICAKSCAFEIHADDRVVKTVSASMSNYIMEVMNSLRKSIPMPTYITFLLDSSGIQRAVGTQTFQKRMEQGNLTRSDDIGSYIFSYDRAIEHLTRFLSGSCKNASAKVLPMIRPILEQWLTAARFDTQESKSVSAHDLKKSSQTGRVIKQLIQTRASLSILAAFALDEITNRYNILKQCPNFFIPAEYLELDEKLDTVILDSIMSTCETSTVIWSASGGQFDDSIEQHLFLARMLGPATILLRYRDGMLKRYLKAVCQRISSLQGTKYQQKDSSKAVESTESDSRGISTNLAEIHMSALLLILKCKEPISISNLVVRNEDLKIALLEVSNEIEGLMKGGHLGYLSGKLQHQVKLICELGLAK